MELIALIVFCINALPPPPSISRDLSPCQIITGMTADYNEHYKLKFGEYVQVHEAHDNTMQYRVTVAIVLCPTGNVQGSYYFMSLYMGIHLNRQHFTPLTLPQEVIDRVHRLYQIKCTGLDLCDHN